MSFKDLLESPVPKKENEEGNAANQSTTAKDILYHTNDIMRFVPISGGFEDIRVSSQTSYSNAAEAEVLVNVIKKFLNEGNITLSQIGVISPYKAQVRHLADRFRSEGWLEQHAPRSIEVFEGKFSKNKKSKIGDGKGHDCTGHEKTRKFGGLGKRVPNVPRVPYGTKQSDNTSSDNIISTYMSPRVKNVEERKKIEISEATRNRDELLKLLGDRIYGHGDISSNSNSNSNSNGDSDKDKDKDGVSGSGEITPI